MVMQIEKVNSYFDATKLDYHLFWTGPIYQKKKHGREVVPIIKSDEN